MHHPIFDDIKAAVEAAENVAERAVAAFNALLAGMQTAVTNSDSLSMDDASELQSILDTAKRTAVVLGPVVANPGTTLPDVPPAVPDVIPQEATGEDDPNAATQTTGEQTGE